MGTKKVIFIALIMVLLLGAISVSAASLNSSAATLPWKTKILDGDEDGVLNLSTAFVGKYQTPMLSYSRAGSTRIYQAHMATSAVAGNCGPDDDWYCTYWQDPDLVPGSVSNMATMQIIDTHLIQWAYSTGSMIRGATIELMNDMSFLDEDFDDLIQLNKFGGILVGTPSLQIRGGHYEMAVTIRDDGGDFPIYQLVYMHYTGNDIKTSCIDSGSVYQCDVIEMSVGWDSMGAPSLQYAEDGTVGIAYYMGNAVKYAYPWGGFIFLRPANCGPVVNEDETWRCIFIDDPSTGTIGPVAKLAFGSTADYRGIVYNFKPTDTDFVMRAIYVGSGGNCGADGLTISLNPVYRWDCNDVDAFIDDIDKTTYSIDFDPQDYPVIAWNNKRQDEAQRLYITYPTARLDGTSAGWTREIIDGNDWSNTGVLASISISTEGLGFVGYMQPSYSSCSMCLIDISPNLKIALQRFTNYLPVAMK